MQKVFRITVDISKKIPAPAFEVNTNDLKSVKLEITITNGLSLLDLTDVTPRINIRKPDNEVIFQDCEIVDATVGKVQIVLENQAYLVPGTHTAEIACYKGNEITAITGTFSYKSIKGIMNDKAVESKSEFTAINRTIQEAERILEDLRENGGGGGAGVDQQARQEIEGLTEQLAGTVKEVNGVKPTNGKITIPVPEVDTSKLATKTELQAVASGSPKGTYATKADLDTAFPTGNTNVYVVAADGKWYYWNGTIWTPGGQYQSTGIAENTVKPVNTTFLIPSTNLFTPTKAIKGVINLSTGEFADSQSYITPNEFVPVVPSSKLTIIGLARIVYYNDNKARVSGFETDKLAVPTTITVPANAAYMKLSTFTNYKYTAQVNRGETLLPYDDGKEKIDKNIALMLNQSDIPNTSVSEEKTTFVKKSSNHFQFTGLVLDKSISGTNGDLQQANSPFSAQQNYLEIKSSTAYTYAFIAAVAYYDETKKFISRIDSNPNGVTTLTSPNNAKFIRYHLLQINVGKAQINEGSSLLSYEKPYLAIDGVKTSDIIVNRNKPYYLPAQDLSGSFLLPDGDYGGFLTIQEVYQGYESLLSRFPHILTKTVLGKDASNTYEIWKMNLNAPDIPSSTVNQTKPKIVLTGGVHGNERPSVIALYRMIKAICENWKEDEFLSFLRWNVNIVFIPCVNPHSYVSDVYAKNANGVDIQKNLPVLWSKAATGSPYNYGAAPLDQVESVYYKNFIDGNKDAMYFGEIHASGFGTSMQDLFYHSLTIPPYDFPELKQSVSYHIKKNTAELIKNYNLPENEGYAGFINENNSSGSPKVYAASLGIPTSVIELYFNLPNHELYDSDSMKSVVECLVNWLMIVVSQYRQMQNI